MHDFYVYSRSGGRDCVEQFTLYGHILHINAPICIVHVAQILHGSDHKSHQADYILPEEATTTVDDQNFLIHDEPGSISCCRESHNPAATAGF